MTVPTAPLADFLLARIAEDEGRVLAECEAKRQIVGTSPWSQCGGHGEGEHPHYPDEGWAFCDGCAAAASADSERSWMLRQLALPYVNHPDYNPDWAV